MNRGGFCAYHGVESRFFCRDRIYAFAMNWSYGNLCIPFHFYLYGCHRIYGSYNNRLEVFRSCSFSFLNYRACGNCCMMLSYVCRITKNRYFCCGQKTFRPIFLVCDMYHTFPRNHHGGYPVSYGSLYIYSVCPCISG